MRKFVMFAGFAIIVLSSLSVFAQTELATTPAILPTFITPTYADPNGKVPTYNAVPGAGVANMDIGWPVNTLVHGSSYVYVLSMTDASYTGTCTLSYKLTQVQSGKTVILDSRKGTSFSCYAGVWWWTWGGKVIPNSPGVATLTGTVTYGTATVSIKNTVLLQ